MTAIHPNLTIFFIGLAIGLFVAFAGGLIEYWLHLRRNREPRFGVPGCLVYTIGGLILAGIAAIVTSLIIVGRIGPALIMGVGVMAGFYGGFVVLVALWLLLDTYQPSPDQSVPSDNTSTLP